jgi:hypothetical protein
MCVVKALEVFGQELPVPLAYRAAVESQTTGDLDDVATVAHSSNAVPKRQCLGNLWAPGPAFELLALFSLSTTGSRTERRICVSHRR